MRLFELAGHRKTADTVVFTFGRFNPPTIGHAKLLDKVASVASGMNADHVVFLSQTHKQPKDPLPWNDKVRLAKKSFPKINISTDETIRTPFNALEELGKQYKNVILVVGNDRVEEFKGRMTPYLSEMGIEKFEVVSAGERDPDSDGVEGMSASKARALATEGNYKAFKAALPRGVSDADAKNAYNTIRQA